MERWVRGKEHKLTTRDAGIDVLPPGAADILVLLEYGKVDVGDAFDEFDGSGEARDASSDDGNADGAALVDGTFCDAL